MESNVYCSTDTTELAKAMLKVQATLQPACKDRENPFTKSTYATLNSIMDSCREALLANSIWLSQYPVPVEPGCMGLVTKLTHAESGQWQSSLLVMPLPKADPQGYGSAMTYGRRYGLAAMVGIVSEDDDDGIAATDTGGKRKRERAKQPPAMEKEPLPANQPSQFSTHPTLASLPKLDGIAYDTRMSQDNRVCIVATGNTQLKKEMLLGIGFKWNAQRKMWWKYAEAA
jgi:hypothetical protein